MSIPIKTPEEIECMRVSCRAAREVLEEVSLAVVPGVSTGEIDKLAARLINDRGGRSPFLNYRGFPGHICISVNDEIVHGIGGARRIQYADIVKLDIGIILHGWVGDTATTIPGWRRLTRRHATARQDAGSARGRHRPGAAGQPRPPYFRGDREVRRLQRL